MSAFKLSLALAVACVIAGGTALAEPQGREHGGDHPGEQHGPPPAPRGEPHQGPRGYQRAPEPHGWNERPKTFDKPTYQHNFQAARNFKVGRTIGLMAGPRTTGGLARSCPVLIGRPSTFSRTTGYLPWKFRPLATSGCVTIRTRCW